MTNFKDPCTMAIESDRLEELNMFMFDTMCSADMAVDWWCDRFGVSATDEVIDLWLMHISQCLPTSDGRSGIVHTTHTTHTTT